MPYTLSHAIIAPLLARAGLPLAAVACGAMAPDLPLFARWLDYDITHSALGAIWASLPIALGLLVIWRIVLVPVLPRLLPRPLARRVPGRTAAAPPAILVAGCVVGVASHLAWDSFTHASGAAVVALPALRAEVVGLPAHQWLQYALSLAGLAGLGALGARWLRRAPTTTDARGASWAWWTAGMVACVAIGGSTTGLGLLLSVDIRPAVVGGVTMATSAAALLLVGAALVTRLRRASS
ncbi:uncharacterized protein DUF4184 [Frondihabitans sp. PhB188]|uniref:DUF4184 family protein n=1 Tax=Frondihabitans sp. PhB188 TaxID=2485200 RepID=UPI000F475E41|nr:DUF4184 family protein [Frondihabitans sp. PhB188]ROQ39715.1 uncharacterized protein DUF4184 [Frondihabitans sp. PhB188]